MIPGRWTIAANRGDEHRVVIETSGDAEPTDLFDRTVEAYSSDWEIVVSYRRSARGTKPEEDGE